jgi:hypothetical protein
MKPGGIACTPKQIINILYVNSLDIRTIMGRINGLAIYFDRNHRPE